MRIQCRNSSLAILNFLATLTLISGCSNKTELTATQTSVNSSTQDIFARFSAVPANVKEAQFKRLGAMTLVQFFDEIAAHMGNKAVSISGVTITNSRDNLLKLRSTIAAESADYANMAQWWAASGSDPRAWNYAAYQRSFVTAFGDPIGLSLEGTLGWANDPTGYCDQWKKVLTGLNADLPTYITQANEAEKWTPTPPHEPQWVFDLLVWHAPDINGGKTGTVNVVRGFNGASVSGDSTLLYTRADTPKERAYPWTDHQAVRDYCLTDHPDGSPENPLPAGATAGFTADDYFSNMSPLTPASSSSHAASSAD